MSATVHSIDFEAWVARARRVPIEDEIRRRGIKLKGHGAERAGPCPKCGGDDRFSINTKKKVFNCRGCEVGGDVIDLVQHLDDCDFHTACARLNNEPPPQRSNGKDQCAEARMVFAAEFEYQNADGTIAFAIDRFEFQNPDKSFVLKDGKHKKTFRRRRPDSENPGVWISNVDGAPVVPYRLPELITAVANKRTILIVEGEAKVDLLRSWNVPATCCAGGAEKWCAEHSEYLRGADVVILPDNDQPGRLHKDVVGGSLQGIAASVRVLNLPGLPPKGDIIDWAKAGGTVERLHDLIAREAQPWTRENQQNTVGDIDQGNNKQQTTLESTRASTFKMASIKWLWPNRLAEGKLAIIAGLPDEGKGQVLSYITAQPPSGAGWIGPLPRASRNSGTSCPATRRSPPPS